MGLASRSLKDVPVGPEERGSWDVFAMKALHPLTSLHEELPSPFDKVEYSGYQTLVPRYRSTIDGSEILPSVTLPMSLRL